MTTPDRKSDIRAADVREALHRADKNEDVREELRAYINGMLPLVDTALDELPRTSLPWASRTHRRDGIAAWQNEPLIEGPMGDYQLQRLATDCDWLLRLCKHALDERNDAHPEERKNAMQCPRRGGSAQQGPNGSWLCPQCGPISGFAEPPAAAIPFTGEQPTGSDA